MRGTTTAVAAVALGGLVACTLVSGAADLDTNEATIDGGSSSSSGSSASSSGGSSSSSSGVASSSTSSSGFPFFDASFDAPFDALFDVNLPCINTSIGPRFAGNVSGAWMNPNAARFNDQNPAHGDATTGPLFASGFNFGAVFPNARILGIEVRIAKSSRGTTSDKTVSFGGANRADNADWAVDPTELQFPVSTYGGPTDLWGATWTAAQVKNAELTIEVNGNADSHIDSIAMTVYVCQ